MPNKCTAWHVGQEKILPNPLKSGGKSGKSLPSSCLETGYGSGDFLCQPFALPVALFAVPLLGEQLQLQALLREFLKVFIQVLYMVLAGSWPRRKSVTILRAKVCS